MQKKQENCNNTSSSKLILTKDQQKCVNLGHELQSLSKNLCQESTFVEHLKKLTKLNEQDY